MAGSGNIELLKRLRRIRTRLIYDKAGSLGYGGHLACHMAIGFLFLGGTRVSLRHNTLDAIAGLYCSIFPRFPNSTSDNRFHLQALRHFWVAAVDDNRLLETRDSETGLLIQIPIHIELSHTIDDSTMNNLDLCTPILLPRIDHPFSIIIQNSTYYPRELVFDRMGDLSSNLYTSHGPLRLFLKHHTALGVDNHIEDSGIFRKSTHIRIQHPILILNQLLCWFDLEIVNSDIYSIHPSELLHKIISTYIEAINQSIINLNSMIEKSPPTFSLQNLRVLKNIYHASRLHLWNYLALSMVDIPPYGF
jgi:hypothetical protein